MTSVPIEVTDYRTMPRLAFLVRRFHAQVERQRRADEQLVAGLERVARDERVRRVIKQICQESEL